MPRIKLSEIYYYRPPKLGKIIEINVFFGDLTKGVEKVKAARDLEYDVILSRGGTAEMISEISSIPVVENAWVSTEAHFGRG